MISINYNKFIHRQKKDCSLKFSSFISTVIYLKNNPKDYFINLIISLFIFMVIGISISGNSEGSFINFILFITSIFIIDVRFRSILKLESKNKVEQLKYYQYGSIIFRTIFVYILISISITTPLFLESLIPTNLLLVKDIEIVNLIFSLIAISIASLFYFSNIMCIYSRNIKIQHNLKASIILAKDNLLPLILYFIAIYLIIEFAPKKIFYNLEFTKYFNIKYKIDLINIIFFVVILPFDMTHKVKAFIQIIEKKI